MKIITVLLIVLSPIFSQSQEFGTDNLFNTLISKTYGDLNKDGIPDLVVVTQDTTNFYAPYRLEVFFTQSDSTKNLIVSTSNAIIPQFPDGKDDTMLDGGFDTVTIKNGVLWIEEGFTRGFMNHKFRYQNNRFELIGFTYSNGAVCCFTKIDYNLSTGRRIETEFNMGTDKSHVVSDTIRKLVPLPNLAEFEVLMGEYF